MGAMKYPAELVRGRRREDERWSGNQMRDKVDEPSQRASSGTRNAQPASSCDIGLVANVLFVVWHQVTPAAVRTVVRELQEAAKLHGAPIIYITIIPDGSPAPDDAGRSALASAVKQTMESCRSMHCVIEGQGFKKTMIRSTAAGIFLLTGKRGKMTVHDSVADALKSADGLQGTVSSILHRARQQGLVP